MSNILTLHKGTQSVWRKQGRRRSKISQDLCEGMQTFYNKKSMRGELKGRALYIKCQILS
jgi:hypothetical protein